VDPSRSTPSPDPFADPCAGAVTSSASTEEVPMPDVMSVLSPLLASSLGVAPQSMRSFLRLDELSLDLLSPLGTARPEAAGAAAGRTFARPPSQAE